MLTPRRAAAILGSLALVASCSRPDDRTPEGAVREFAAASARGDTQRVVEMLDRSTLDRLAARAREASDIAGGGVDLRPADLLAVGFEPAGIEIRRTRRKKASDGHVVVTVKDAAGHTTDVRLRSEEGRWKIVLDF